MSQGFTKGVPVDTDVNLSANSDLLIPSQKAVKAYIDNKNSTAVILLIDGGSFITPTPNLLIDEGAF